MTTTILTKELETMAAVAEVWKGIPGYESTYQISSLGRVKSLRRNLIMSPGKTGSGYLFVFLYSNNVPFSVKIHRVVAKCFVANPNSYNEVNHIDGDKLNNAASNIEWTTRLLNMQHAHNKGLIKYQTGSESHRAVSVKDTFSGNTYPTIKAAAKVHGLSPSLLRSYLVGIAKNKTTLVYV